LIAAKSSMSCVAPASDIFLHRNIALCNIGENDLEIFFSGNFLLIFSYRLKLSQKNLKCAGFSKEVE
jgi:hypothetical protein